MFALIENKIEALGVPAKFGEPATLATLIIGILVLSFLADIIVKRFLVKTIQSLAKRSQTQWDDALIRHHVFSRLAHIVPALAIYALAAIPFPDDPNIVAFIKRAALAYIIVIGLMVVSAVINSALYLYDKTPVSRERPLKSYAQVAKIILYVVGAIIAISLLINRSAAGILTGLGAMMAIILLVFKDSILGFVAGVQLTANDMMRKGDWIEMPKYGADGEVLDIALTTVKVQNWDKTITTIPTYSLVADAFKNWRGMSESGARRIKRSIYIDMNSIRTASAKDIDQYGQIQCLFDYVREKKTELQEYNQEHAQSESDLVNGRQLTNVGTYRAYIYNYLRQHPKIHQDMTLIVRHLKPGATGLPIEIYCFSNDTEWASYENIQSDIFDHLLAITREFDLRVFQNPSGGDFSALTRA